MKDTRNLIIKKTLELYKEMGYENTTVTAICKACSITKGTFYYHFPNKDEITFAYYEQLYEGIIDIVPSILSETNAKEQLWKVIEYSIDNTIALTPTLLKAVLLSDFQRGMDFFSPKKAPYNSENRLKQYDLQVQLLTKGQVIGEIRKGKPKLMLETFYAALIGIAMDWSSSGGTYDEKEELRKMFDVIF